MVAARASTPVGPPLYNVDERFQVLAVVLVESVGIDFGFVERAFAIGSVMLPSVQRGGIIPRPSGAASSQPEESRDFGGLVLECRPLA